MQWSRRSISWTSFSSRWVRARDSNRDVDLAVGRPIVPAHTGRGYRAESRTFEAEKFTNAILPHRTRAVNRDLAAGGAAVDQGSFKTALMNSPTAWWAARAAVGSYPVWGPRSTHESAYVNGCLVEALMSSPRGSSRIEQCRTV